MFMSMHLSMFKRLTDTAIRRKFMRMPSRVFDGSRKAREELGSKHEGLFWIRRPAFMWAKFLFECMNVPLI